MLGEDNKNSKDWHQGSPIQNTNLQNTPSVPKEVGWLEQTGSRPREASAQKQCWEPDATAKALTEPKGPV